MNYGDETKELAEKIAEVLCDKLRAIENDFFQAGQTPEKKKELKNQFSTALSIRDGIKVLADSPQFDMMLAKGFQILESPLFKSILEANQKDIDRREKEGD
jgi:hypothetical protein